MHLLSIAPAFSTTGVTVHVEQINDHLLATGHSVSWAPLCLDAPRLEWCRGKQRATHSVTLVDHAKNWFAEKLALADAYVEAISCMASPEPITLIHSHDWLAALIGRRIAKQLRCPHLTTVHTLAEIQRERVGLPGRLPVHLGQIALERQLCQTSEKILTVGEAIKKLIMEIGQRPSEEVNVIPNGVDLKHLSNPPPAAVARLRQQLAPNGEQLVLFVGRLAPQKGLDFLLRSTYLVHKKRPATRWVVVGDGVAAYMMKPVYEQVMRDGGYRDHLRFEGRVSWENIALYYRAADCIVLPSLFECCPYVVLEAMAAGTCVVATDLDSLRELIVHGENGLLVPIDERASIRGPSVTALAQAQIEVLADAALRQFLTKAASEVVAKHFTLNKQLNAIMALYADILLQQKTDNAEANVVRCNQHY